MNTDLHAKGHPWFTQAAPESKDYYMKCQFRVCKNPLANVAPKSNPVALTDIYIYWFILRAGCFLIDCGSF